MQRLAFALVLGFLLTAGVAPAHASLEFEPCAQFSIAGCATVQVPIDRSGAVPGTVRLHVRRVPATGPRRGVLLALSGGPGQATSPFTDDIAVVMRSALRSRDLLVFDQRGTGRSGLLRCPTLEGLGARLLRVAGAAADCAEEIGARRAFYSTLDSVEDIEAIRSALGVERLTLYGVSYGTKVALAYAARYPQRVERMVLDSVVDLDGPDALALDVLGAMPRVLGRLCAQGCERITSDPVADVAALVKKLSSSLLRGPLVKPDGRRHMARFGRVRLFDLIAAGDFDPTLRSGLPAAVRSALDGDPAALLRLADRADRLESGTVGYFNPAVFAATLCEDGPLPWTRASSAAQRTAETQARLAAMPDSAFAPFDRTTALAESQPFELCRQWPSAPTEPPLARGPLPDVPALLLSGETDLRTPAEEARQLAARLPRATLLTVPQTGHDVLDTELGSCSRRALRSFFSDRRVTPCREGRTLFPPDPIAPTSLAQVLSAGGQRGRSGRTLGAVALTLRDSITQLVGQLVSFDSSFLFSGSVGGLRGGRVVLGLRGIRFDGVVYVPGVRVDGRIGGKDRLEGSLRISGRDAARGRLRLRRNGSLVGRLGGRRVRLRLGKDLFAGGNPFAARALRGR